MFYVINSKKSRFISCAPKYVNFKKTRSPMNIIDVPDTLQ